MSQKQIAGLSTTITGANAKATMKELLEICSFRPSAEMLAGISSCYFVLGQSEAALDYGLQAIAMDSTLAPAILNVGIILKDLGRYDEAYVYIAKAYTLNPDLDYGQLAQAEALLRQQKWTEAWPLFDGPNTFRPTKHGAPIQARLPASVKCWDGKEEVGELIVLSEGGAGDRINFARWLPELTKRGINWKFHLQGPIKKFFARAPWMDGHQIETDIPECSATHWTTTMALPAQLGATPETIPQYPYPLTADPELLTAFQIKSEAPTLGLCWSAGEQNQGIRRVRSMTEGQAMRLVSKTDHKVAWINLCFDKELPWPVHNFPGLSWEEMGALMANLDGIVSVDTGPMHLAGAMGLPMSTLLTGNTAWFFPDLGSQCQLWPTNKLYYNHGFGIDNAINALITVIREGQFPEKKISVITPQEFKTLKM